MKINEKNLAAFAISATPVDKEGYLNKRGYLNKAFQKRYFVLKGNLLFYFDKKFDKEAVGVIILEGCTIELCEDEEKFCFKIEFHGTNNRSYVLGADSQEFMEEWMKALARASYDYMKLMVADLQKQLDDMEDNPAPLAQATGSPIPPPRQRHNPFNKIENSPHQRSHSMRSSSSRADDTNTSNDNSNSKPQTTTFWELHNLYGRRILNDLNAWKYEQKKSQETGLDVGVNLITF